MTNTRQARANKGNRIAFGVLIAIVSLFCFLSDVGALGGVGRMVAGFLVGFFGLASYAYSLMGLIGGIAIVFNVRRRQRASRTLLYFGLLLLGIFALHIYSSSGNIHGAKYGEYLLACYMNTNTAGGMLFGILAYPLMKLITPVGALVVASVAFLLLGLLAIFPGIRRNYTYTAADKKERNASPKQPRVRKPKKVKEAKIERADIPAITDFSKPDSADRLYVVDVDAEPPRGRFGARGAEGYRALGGFDPLFPNRNGGYEDEAVAPVARTDYGIPPVRRRTYAPDEFPAQENPPMRGVGLSGTERQDILGGMSGDEVRNQFIQGRRPDSAPRYGEPTLNGMNMTQMQEEERAQFTRRAPSFMSEARSTPETSNPVRAEQPLPRVLPEDRTVVRPTRRMARTEDVNPTVQAAQDAVGTQQVNVGMLGAINRARTPEQPEATAQTTYAKPAAYAEAYLSPTQERNDVYPADAPKPAQPVQPVQPVQSVQYTQPAQPVQYTQPTQPAPYAQPVQPAFEEEEAQDDGRADQGRIRRPDPNTLTYSPAPSDGRLARAFSGTAVEGRDTVKPAAVQDTPHGVPSPPRQREQKPQEESVAEPVHQPIEVTGGDMSPSRIQQATDIAHQSARDIERAEIHARMQNVRKNIGASPSQEQELRAEKVKAANGRGLSAQPEQRRAAGGDTAEKAEQPVVEETKPRRPYMAPPVSLLNPPVLADDSDRDEEEFERKKASLIKVLDDFDITAKFLDKQVGPTFTLFSLAVEMKKGRSVSSILGYTNDIAMKMEIDKVRILAPIPGKNAIGVEIPNKHPRKVTLSEVIESEEFNTHKDPDTFAIGVNLYGKSVVDTIDNLPHLLIAGSTGAGKSCCVHSLIVSLLYHSTPDDVRFILIDPKLVEFMPYAGIPHLLMNEIINNPEAAIRALNWAVGEMERRLGVLAQYGCQKISDYNNVAIKKGMKKMYRIIIIIDEFADLMSTSKKQAENLVQRLAAKARAAGIHLIIATQRPSVDVISGTIKNNIPCRIALRVSDNASSRTILDSIGAESLLGNGDLLYLGKGKSMPERIQGAYISSQELVSVIDYVKANNDTDFDEEARKAIVNEKTEKKEEKQSGKSSNEDSLLPDLVDALDACMNSGLPDSDGRISINLLQRRCGFGWPKASRIFDELVKRGYVELYEPKKYRCAITEEELDELKALLPQQNEE